MPLNNLSLSASPTPTQTPAAMRAGPRLLTLVVMAGAAALVALGGAGSRIQAQSGCAAAANPVACENLLPGDPASAWDVSGSGDSTIQGFATDFSLVRGQTQRFKIDTDSNNYTIDIYRMGYYGGFGARRVATISPSASLPQAQPNCLTVGSTGLVDCGNWGVSASWTIPADAVSGIYFAKPTRVDNGGASHIFFIVRDDSGGSDVVFQTSDTTWQAYNSYGGNSFYQGGPGVNPGRAYEISYNRPFNTRAASPEDWVFNAEYPMVRWLEKNGFNVSYIGGADTDRAAAELLEHKVFLSVGHDEYWSGTQRANVEAARAAGVHLAFFSGNEVYWKTRWSPSIEGTATPYRTLVSYKETHANAVIDPAHPTWTGTWRDPRFSPPADGGRPEHNLTGTIFRVNDGNTTSITVPSADGKMRFWRNTSVATLAAGAVATLPNGTLGYEWDEAPNDAFTPSGLMRLSTTTRSVTSILLDYGSTYGPGTATHSLTLYRAPSGALVFGAGTIQWSWGLDANHDRGSTAADARMKQATVNLFADMDVLPATLEAGLTPATPSSDATAPTSIITSPAAGASISAGTNVTISGTSSDAGGGIVAGVEVSVNGGATWARATGGTSWTFSWTASGVGAVSIRSRAFDDSGNFETPSAGVGVTITSGQTCPCSIWTPSSVPPIADDGDPAAVEVGTRFRSDVNGFITGIRFYKASANTGTHTGRLWTNTGTLLATVTFTGETATGWQQALLASAVPITANTTYLVSYHAPNGHYTGTDGFFATSGLDNPPLHGLREGVDGSNGVYRYGAGGVFPTDTYLSEGYWADVVFSTVPPPDAIKPTITSFFPATGAGGVDPATVVTATFSEAMDPATISSSSTGFVGEGGASLGTFELRDSLNNLVNATVTYEPTTRVATLRPDASLALSTTYTALVKGGAVDPRVKDLAGNALAANATWSFTTAAAPPPPPTCPCSIWTPTTVPQKIDDGDPNSVELGTRFRSDVAGFITGARFYKGSLNTGTHIAKLWTNAGVLLGSATFTGESASGWQETTFTTPIAIGANTTYLISYHANNGHYSSAAQYFATAGVDNGPLHALRDGQDGLNGVYQYGASTFPTQTWQSEGYFIDVVFNTTNGPDVTKPVVTSVAPVAGLSGIGTTTNVLATFNEAMSAATITTGTVLLRDPLNATVPAAVTYNTSTRTATLDPTAPLAYLTTYTATIKGGATDPRVKDVAGNALAADHTWSFTTAAPPPPPPTEGPGGPVLVITSPANPFSTYLAEILRTEGLNAFTTAELSSVNAGTLTSYDLVILGETPLTAGQVSMFSDWVTQGGNLVAMRPDKQLAGLMGLTDAASTLANAYLLVNTTAAPGAGIVNQTIQFHGTADRYTLSGATAIATLYSTANAATANPAVTMRTVGAGHAVAFTYDLARSIVYTRQGNPAWSGQERDGLAPIRSDDLYFGAKAGDVQPDWVDFSKIAIPQADEQQRLLWNILLHTNSAKKPLPRFWYFPRMLKAVVIMTGDDHANGGTAGRFDQYMSLSAPGCSVADWACIRGTSYLFPTTPLDPAQVSNYVAQGFELGLHVNTQCADYTPATLQSFYSTQLTQFATAFPAVPPPATNRTHCIVFSDYATQPQVSLANGIRFDTNYYYWPATWVLDRPGMFTGSGMPMRFASATGTMIDVYQAASQLTDESGLSYSFHANTLFDRALGAEGYYGAFTANMHTDFNPSEGSIGSDAIIASAQSRGVPVISAKQMLDWLDGRNGSSFASLTWNNNQLGFDIAVGSGATGLHSMVPATAGGAPIQGITVNGTVVAHTVQTIKGVSYAVFPAQSGAYLVSYGNDVTPPAISSVSASATAAAATIQWVTDEPANSRVDYGTSPTALTQSISSITLTTAHGVTIPGLAASTVYYYRVSSADAGANLATSPATGNPAASFTTSGGLPAPTASFSASPVSITGGQGSTLTWATTDAATVTIDQGIGTVAASGSLAVTPAATTTYTLTATNATGTVVRTATVTVTAPSGTQVSGLTAFHRNGQTFVTWLERDALFSNTTTYTNYDAIVGANANQKYRLYRSATPITAATLGQATPIAEVGVGSGYNRWLYGYQVDGAPDNLVRRFVITEDGTEEDGHAGGWRPTGTGELPLNTGLRVYSLPPGESGSFYYAATSVRDGVENTAEISAANSLTTPLAEQYDANWKPIVQNNPASNTYTLIAVTGKQYIYTRWESDPLSNVNSNASNYMVALMPGAPQPYKLDLGLHCWGSSLVACQTYMNFPDGMFLTTTDYSPQSWWTGFNSDRNGVNCATTPNSCNGINKFYTMHRIDSFIGWMKTRWAIDDNRVMCSGVSMGGTGGKMYCLRTGEVYSYVNSWVGIGNPQGSATFLNEFENLFGTVAQGKLSENGINTWVDLDMAQWLRSNPARKTPFISYANGKNDTAIGWQHAVALHQALRDTKRPYTFVWGQDAHSQRADDMSLTGLGSTAGTSRLDFQKNKAVPAFANFSLDANPGDGSTTTGADTGAVNLYQRWNPNTIVDQASHFEIDLWLVPGAPAQGITDITPRYAQAFTALPGQVFSWQLLEGATVVQSGTGTADSLGLVTVPALVIKTTPVRRLVIDVAAPVLPALSISDATIVEGNSGTAIAAFTVTLSAASSQPVTVAYATANGTATAGSDYVAGSGILTLSAGTTSAVLNVTVNGDAVYEPTETFVVNLSAPANATVADAQATGTITNDEALPSLSIGDATVTEGNTGSLNAVSIVTLSGSSSQTITVAYATASGTATVAGGDYLTASGTLTFAPGVTSQSISVQVFGDTVDEADETFVVDLSVPANATLADAQGTVTITDDDPQPSIAIGDLSLSEGNSGTTVAAFTLTLSGASSNNVTVGYGTADGTATAGSDYLAASGTATFAPGFLTTTVSVTVNGDTIIEADESFVVNLSGPVNATIADGAATGILANDDGVPAVSITDALVTEGNIGSVDAILTVSLSTPGVQAVTLSYATVNGTATAGSDYTLGSGSLTFLAGETSKTITIPVTGDATDEPDETFSITLSAPVNATLLDAQGTVTITDDDPTPSLAISDVLVTEGNAGGANAVFAVTLSGASGSTVTVSYATANGSATAGADYTAASGTLSFAPGETSKSITVAATGDATDEPDESFVVNLTAPANATIADAQGTGTIADDDPTPSIAIADVSLTEGNSGTKLAAFTLTLSNASSQAVTVAYATANGTAAAGSDYVAATGTATFAAGATSATVNVTINGDITFELNETLVVDLSAPANATILDAQATGTITNDDALPTLSITDATVAEGNTGSVTANLNVNLSAASSQTVTVAFATANGTATAGTDYTAASGTLTFLPGVVSQPIAIAVTGDTVTEPAETVLVNLTSPINATVLDSQGVVTITNDDGTLVPGLVAAYGFNEGAGLTTADASGAGQTGSIAGATWTAAGKNGNALSFDGVNDMVTVADTAALDVTRVTVMAWLRPTALGDWRSAVLKETTNGLAYGLYANNNASRPEGYVNLGDVDRSANGAAAMALNTWTHLATTFDGANLRLYVNGVLVRTRAFSGNIITSAQALRIGGNSIWGEFFAGQIDDVRIFNRALSLAEVQTTMNTAVTP